MKYMVAQIAFKLPDNFDIEKQDLNAALEALIIYRMTRDLTSKNKKVKLAPTGQWNSIDDLWKLFLKDLAMTDRKLVASFGMAECPDPPKIAAKKPRRR